MRYLPIVSCATLAFSVVGANFAHGDSKECPVSSGEHMFPEAAFPGSFWYGSHALAVALPKEGAKCSTTKLGANLSMKLFWWSDKYVAGTSQPFVVSAHNLHGDPGTIRITPPHNATHTADGGPPHAMLVGLDIQDPGCWEITGEFLGETLTIIVESTE